MNEKLIHLEDHLRAGLRGQDHVVPRVASLLRRGELGLRRPGRPKGSFLFLGPTGVGKTELTLRFTHHLFGNGGLFRFDMSEYQNQSSLALLLGANASEGGSLGAAFEQANTGTFLFDEIEKAHPRILDIFLQILSAARVTLSNGRTLDLSGFYIVLTSNLGASELLTAQHSSFATIERRVLTIAQQALRPELYARINEKIVFNRLSYDVQLDIARLLVDAELTFLRQRGHEIEIDDDVLPLVVRVGFHPRLGARPMSDAVERLLEDAVARALLDSGHARGTLRVDDGETRLVLR